MDTKAKIMQRLRYVPTILWVILAFLIALGVAAYVTQNNEVANDNQNEATVADNGEENGANQEVAGNGDNNENSEGNDETTGNGEEGVVAGESNDEELPEELAAAGPAEDVAVMVAVTSTLGVIYLGSRKRLETQSRK